MGLPAVSMVLRRIRQSLAADALAGMTDRELLERFAREGDEAAFTALVVRHGPLVWGVCRRMLSSREDAEDAFQATFLILVRRAGAIQRPELLGNWLFGVARRVSARARTVRARRSQHELVGPDMPDPQAHAAEPWDDGTAILDEELAKLPEKYRLPLLLCGLEGMTHAAAGQKLGWPTGTVAGRLSRGRDLLRRRLLRRGVTVSATAVAALLAREAAAAAVPRALVSTTIEVAAMSPTAVSAGVTTLVQGALKQMLLRRVLKGAALLLLMGAAVGGALWQAAPSGEPESLPPPACLQAPEQPVSLVTSSVRLPGAPAGVVVRMERFLDAPDGPRAVVTIRADGRMTVELPDGVLSLSPAELTRYAKAREEAAQKGRPRAPETIQVFETRLTRQQLDELLRFATEDQGFFQLDPAEMKAAVRREYQAEGAGHDATDATTTRLQIRTAGREHEVAWSHLTYSAFKFTKVKQLAQLHAVDMRLRHAFALMRGGGPEEVEAVLQQANELLQPTYAQRPETPKLKGDDLVGVTALADGGTRYLFVRYNGVVRIHFMATIDVPFEGPPRIHQLGFPAS